MSIEEQATAIGKLILEQQQAKRHLQLMRSEARRKGEALVRLGQQLQTAPEQVQFYGVMSEGQYRTSITNLDPQEYDIAKLIQLVQDIRAESSRLQDLDRELSNAAL